MNCYFVLLFIVSVIDGRLSIRKGKAVNIHADRIDVSNFKPGSDDETKCNHVYARVR